MTTVKPAFQKHSIETAEKSRPKRTKAPTKPFANEPVNKISLPQISQYTFVPSEIVYEEIERTVIIKVPPASGANTTAISTATAAGAGAADAGAPDAADANVKKKDEPLKQVIKETRVKPNPLVPNSKAYWKALKDYNHYHGQRRYVQFVIPIGTAPHILLFNLNTVNKEWTVPGGYLEHDEDEEEGLQRVWNTLFKAEGGFKIKRKELLAKWHRPELKVNVYPYKSKYLSSGKELVKVYLVQLEDEKKKVTFLGDFKNFLPLDIYDLYDLKNPELKAIPLYLSKYEFEKA